MDDEESEDEDFVDDGSGNDDDDDEDGEEEQEEDMSMIDENVDKDELKALSKNEKTSGKRRRKWIFRLKECHIKISLTLKLIAMITLLNFCLYDWQLSLIHHWVSYENEAGTSTSIVFLGELREES